MQQKSYKPFQIRKIYLNDKISMIMQSEFGLANIEHISSRSPKQNKNEQCNIQSFIIYLFVIRRITMDYLILSTVLYFKNICFLFVKYKFFKKKFQSVEKCLKPIPK